MNPDLDLLQPYPFERLRQLKGDITPPQQLNHIALSIGEPKHSPPSFVTECLMNSLAGLSSYPATKGVPELRQAITDWLTSRFKLNVGSIDPETQVLPVNGTREALFAFAQAVVDNTQSDPLVIMPNPFYQIYEGAALLAGAKPHFLNCIEDNHFEPDFNAVPADVWQRCQLIYICTPGNPTGAVAGLESLKQLIALADQYDFIIASDECYSEIYLDEDTPPVGLLEACQRLGRNDYKRCVIFQSLSKRSNLPGLRSGFVAGDADIIQRFLSYRTYHGCAMPVPSQHASIEAWQDEKHVIENRTLYREKFTAVSDILRGHLDVTTPDGGFFFWAETPIDDQQFTQQLFAAENVTVLPGSFLARDTESGNPGSQRVRIALVAPIEECVEAANRIVRFVKTLSSLSGNN